MTRRRGALIGIVAVAILGVAAATFVVASRPGLVDLTLDPQTVYATNPFEVGESYSLGDMSIPAEVPRPVTVTDVSVVHASGVEQIGAGLFDAGVHETGVGLVPGWPPSAFQIVDPAVEQVAWAGEVAIVVGVRTEQPKSGLRGVRVAWVDGTGQRGQRVFDVAVLTCAPAACSVVADLSSPLLTELGLRK